MLSFIDFLKKYSNVPNQFIDDFFSLMNNKEFESDEYESDSEIDG